MSSTTTSFTGELAHTAGDASLSEADANRRRQQKQQQQKQQKLQKQKTQKQSSQQPRQLLSCTKCRERKVKCDRTKPCQACCARGAPKECHFIAEGGDYAPIQQSYELKRLRAENLRLKEKLRAGEVSVDDDDSDHANSPGSQRGDRINSLQNRRASKQKRFQGSEWQDSLYFGYPSYHAVLRDFAAINVNPGSTSASLAYLMPRGADMYSSRNPPTYPFPTMFPATPMQCIPALLSCLPSKEELLESLMSFEKRVSAFSFPYMPVELSKSEVERFLAGSRNNDQVCPDMLALLFAALALGCQHSVWDKTGGHWSAEVMNAEMKKGEVYIAAAMQGLRLASFMQKPSLLAIQALVMIGPWLTNSGRFLDAWSLFGLTIRLAQSIGLHRHPKYLDPAPSTPKECSVRQTIWWWMLRMDEQYSMTLGRPLGISGIGDCSWPHELTTDATMKRFREFINSFTILARQILGSDNLTAAKIDEYTDKLRALLETMPETLHFNESWLNSETAIPEWPLGVMSAMYYCKAHTYLILLNRQRIEKYAMNTQASNSRIPNPPFRMAARTLPSFPPAPSSAKSSLRGRPLVISSSEDILNAFLFFYRREPAALIDWSIGQQAFNACMIVLLDAIENRQITTGPEKAEAVYGIFKELQLKDVHKLAGLAIEKISWALQELSRVMHPASNEPSTEGSAETPNEGRENAGSADSVMGNSGMLLLEDSGLQSFNSESWSPITWNMAQGESRAMDGLKSERAEDELRRFRAVDGSHGSHGMHDMRRSMTMGSTSSRYPTPSEDDQPLGYSDAASNVGLGLSQHGYLNAPMKRQVSQDYPLLHESQILESSPTVESMGSSTWEYEVVPSTRSQIHDGSSLTPPTLQHQVSPIQFRHNSCPLIPDASFDGTLRRPRYSSPSCNSDRPTAPPVLRGTSLRSSMTANMGTDPAPFHDYLETFSPTNAHVDIPISAGGTGPMFSMADAAGTGFLPTTSTSRMPLMSSTLPQSMVHSQPYPFSSHSSDSSMSSFDTVSVKDWRRGMGISEEV